MNLKQVAIKLRALVPNDPRVEDYLDDLDGTFEPAAYANMTDAELVADYQLYVEEGDYD